MSPIGQVGDADGLPAMLLNQAEVLIERGEDTHAMVLLRQTERMSREADDPEVLAVSLEAQARILNRQGESDAAVTALLEGEKICRGLADQAGLRQLLVLLNRHTSVLLDRRDLAGATEVCQEQVCVCRELGASTTLALSLAGLAHFLILAGRAPEALPVIEEAHEIATSAGLADLTAELAPMRAVLRRTV